MSKNSRNPAVAHMDLAQDEIATYAMLLKKAQSSLIASTQAFERANETSRAGDCPTRKQITQQLREQYKALKNLTDAIVGTLDAPTFSRIINTAPKRSPGLLALLELLPEEEKELLLAAFSTLFILGQSEMAFLSKEQVELAQSILPKTYERNLRDRIKEASFSFAIADEAHRQIARSARAKRLG